MLSLKFNNVYINDYEAVVGPNEKKGNIKKVGNVINDFYYNEKSFELAQIRMQREVLDNLLLRNKDADLIIGGDLSNQIGATTYACNNYNISFMGVYTACASFIEGLIIASLFVSNDISKKVINITSSHNLAAERQFRFPVEYGVLRNVNSTFTATASVGCVVCKKRSNIKIIDATIGTPVEFGIKTPNDIGAIMAPSTGETIRNHLLNLNRKIDYYDLILTGDLGEVGTNILKSYLEIEYNLKSNNIIDAGSNIYNKIDDINDGASGPAVLPLYFFYNILNNKKYKKILLVGTGALHSRSLVNQKISIPGISHAISIEVKRWVYYMLFYLAELFV